MRICFITSFLGRIYGGAEISIGLLAAELQKREHEIYILSTRKAKNKSDVITIPNTSWIPKKLLVLGNYILDRFIAQQIKRKVEKIQPDIIHIQDKFITPASLLAVKKLGIPSVVTVRESILDWVYDLIVPFPISHLAKKRKRVIIKYLKQAAGIISVSKYIKKELISVGLDSDKISPIYNLPPRWGAGNTEEKYNSSKMVLFSPVRLNREKGCAVLLEALHLLVKKYPQVVLIIAGEGPERRKLERLARSLSIEPFVTFTGKLSYSDVMKLYLRSDIILMLSTYPEPFSRIPLEAMGAGKPIIATNVGGTSEAVINEVNGLLIPPNNIEKTAEAITQFIENPRLRKRMGENGKKILKENFDQEKIIDKTIKVYRSILM